MYKYKIGDTVQITESACKFFHAGDRAVIFRIDSDGDYWANFNNCDNYSVFGDGLWCIGRNLPESSYGRFVAVSNG